MSDDDTGGDNVITVNFGAKAPETTVHDYADHQPRPESLAYCRHRHTDLYPRSRQIVCADCGKLLDPFDLLLQYANRERSWRHYETEEQETRARNATLLDEEKRIKARIRSAKRRDVEEALELQRKQLRERERRIEMNAREIAELAGRIARAVRAPKGGKD